MNKLLNKSITVVSIILLMFSLFIFSSCNSNNAVSEDTIWYLDTLNSSILGVSFDFFVDENSYIILRKDGTATISIKAKSNLHYIINYLLDSEPVKNFDLRSVTDGMAPEYFPGFSLYDMKASFDLLTKSIGVTFTGIDFEDPDIAAMFSEVAESGRIPSNLKIPEGIGVEYNANYHIKEVFSEYTGKYSAVYMGEHHPDGEPFIMMTMSEDASEISLRIEMIKMLLIAEKA